MEEILSEETLNRIKTITFRARFLANEVFSGNYRSAFKGRGIEFMDIREYLPGDDVRTIDWKVSARSQKIFVRTYREEREQSIVFMVDLSNSSAFGSGKRTKGEISSEITALLSYAAVSSGDKVGLLIFTDRVELYIPPKKGRAHIFKIIREILHFRPRGKGTDFQVPLHFISSVLKRKTILFLISDFIAGDFENSLSATATRHDLVAVTLRDPKERELPDVGMIELMDMESGELMLVDTAKIRTEYEAFMRNGENELAKFFMSRRIDHISIWTDHDYVEQIVQFFRMRERRKSTGR